MVCQGRGDAKGGVTTRSDRGVIGWQVMAQSWRWYNIGIAPIASALAAMLKTFDSLLAPILVVYWEFILWCRSAPENMVMPATG